MATTNVTPISDDVSLDAASPTASVAAPHRARAGHRRWALSWCLLRITALATLGVRNDPARPDASAMQEGRRAARVRPARRRRPTHFDEAAARTSTTPPRAPTVASPASPARSPCWVGTSTSPGASPKRAPSSPTPATELVDAVRTLPDGLGSLAPHRRLAPDRRRSRASATRSWRPRTERAQRSRRSARRRRRSWPGPVADARFEAERQVEQAADAHRRRCG